MNDLMIIAGGAGLRDGLDPCIFMACAVFIAHGFWLKRNSLRIGFSRIAFGLVYAAGILVFNFGPLESLLFNKNIVFAAKIIYFLLGLWAFISGVLFFKDWVSLRQGLPDRDLMDKEIKPFKAQGSAALLMAIVLAAALSSLATLWPINNYIAILGYAAYTKGQWQMVMPVLVGYILISMWPLWLVWAFLSIKNLRPSLLKIVCSSIFFTASSCMIFIFK